MIFQSFSSKTKSSWERTSSLQKDTLGSNTINMVIVCLNQVSFALKAFSFGLNAHVVVHRNASNRLMHLTSRNPARIMDI